MHDDGEMTAQFRDQFKQALEQQREINAKQAELNAKHDALTEVLATHDDLQIEDVPEAERIQ